MSVSDQNDETQVSPAQVGSALELLQLGIEIEGVTFYSLSASLSEEIEGEVPAPADIVPTYGLKTNFGSQSIGIRLVTRVMSNVGTIEVDVAVTYRTKVPVTLDEEVVLEFANEVGVMALLPYVREAISTLSARVFGNAVLMPILMRGDLVFNKPQEAESSPT
ncbi:MAG: hypothetical protein LCH43_09425 [Actinobacteria bacterium]|nr:hypothetical protein [Actinomycetota bacterium]